LKEVANAVKTMLTLKSLGPLVISSYKFESSLTTPLPFAASLSSLLARADEEGGALAAKTSDDKRSRGDSKDRRESLMMIYIRDQIGPEKLLSRCRSVTPFAFSTAYVA
jgi:hypothetical protein